MFRGVGQSSGANPAARFLIASVAAAVLIGDGLVLVGFTGEVTGRALPSPAAGAIPGAVPPVLSAPPAPTPGPLTPNAGGPVKPGPVPGSGGPATAPAPARPPAPNRASPGPPEGRGPHGGGHGGYRDVGPGRRWPEDLPDPRYFDRHGHGPSPFARRCAEGDIGARWCHGFPH